MLEFLIYYVWLQGIKSNLTSDDMADIRIQGISVNDDIGPSPENIHVPKNITLPQLEENNSWIPEGIIFPGQSENLQNTHAAFKNYSCEEVMKMMKLGMSLILSSVNYLK